MRHVSLSIGTLCQVKAPDSFVSVLGATIDDIAVGADLNDWDFVVFMGKLRRPGGLGGARAFVLSSRGSGWIFYEDLQPVGGNK